VTEKAKYTAMIKAEASRLGFMYCGISEAGFLEEEAPGLEKWLSKNQYGEMAWMENHFDKRLDPTLLVEGAKSVISLLLNYYPEEKQEEEEDIPKISKYAWGNDYHHVIKGKLKELLHFIRENIGEVNGRAFTDSAPVMEKAWAKKSGLGWVGKNSNLINKNAGSFFFIAELITDLALEYDGPVKDYCGTCTKCIDACPTDAIAEPFVVDGSRCISYFTIELKNEIPADVKGKFSNWMFGCDICQDVCPWNRFSKPHAEPLFSPLPGLLSMKDAEWEEMTREVFGKVFKNSPLRRPGFDGIKRNLKFIRK
jgi:epoxyqueuosine reductase